MERIYSSVLSDSITVCKNKPGTHSITISFFSKFFDANQGKVEGKLHITREALV